MTSVHLRRALLPDGWAGDVRLTFRDGVIAAAEAGQAPAAGDARHAVGVPGMANLHSHAFQRAMAGLAERRGPSADKFWTWRETMYRFALSMTPDEIEAVAALALCRDAGSRFYHASANSTICTTRRTASPTPISAKWRSASSRPRPKPASA